MIIKTECPNCEGEAREVWKDQDVPYGNPPVRIVAHVPVIECATCGGDFTDWRAERIRETTVHAYLQGAGK